MIHLLALLLLFCAACGPLSGSDRDRTDAPRAAEPGTAVVGAAPSPAAGANAAATRESGAGAAVEPRPVLQLGYGGGLGNLPLGPPDGPDVVTSLTLWDDGRVVFRPSRGEYREARLSAGTVAAVLAAAVDLYALGDFYAGFGGTDAASSVLTVETARGRKTVEAYGMNPYAARPGEGSHAELERLRAVWQFAVAALPPDAPAMAPDDVIVSLSPGIGRSFPGDPSCAALDVRREWPSSFVGRLTGDAAREAVGLAGVGPATLFCVDGAIQRVALRPILPSLSAPGRNWPYGGLARHPAATAYETGEYWVYLYRAPGVPQTDLAAYYRTEMDARGWRLARETGNDRQVWVRPRLYEPAPIVEMRFGAGQVEVRYVSHGGGGIPWPPGGVLGTCADPMCQVLPAAPDALTAWFREYLGYLGWAEVGPDRYQREWTLLRLELSAESGGTVVRAVTSPASSQPPLPPGSLPYSASRSTPLCEATRGGRVEIAGRTIALHESLCITIRTSDLVRIQVAYGESYMDVDPATGLSPGAGPYNGPAASSMSGDGPYAAHLHALAAALQPDVPGRPPPPGRAPASPTPPATPLTAATRTPLQRVP